MISSVSIDAGGQTYILRMSTRAMMAAEDRFGADLPSLLEQMEASPRIGVVVGLIQECMNDGKGVDLEAAQAMVDLLGLAKVAAVLGDVASAAFPEASKEKN